jgi:fumarylacetoacetase
MANHSESWVDIDAASEFSLANLPFGIISTKGRSELRVGVAIGNYALDLSTVCSGPDKDEELWRLCWGRSPCVVVAPTLNGLAALGSERVRKIRTAVRRFLSGTRRPSWIKQDGSLPTHIFIPLSEVQMHLPMATGDYTDFYAGMHHAFAVGCMFRGPNNALQPNYKHLPVGYHGRSSSLVVSGTPIHRPRGQILDPSSADPKQPTTGPSKKLDFELEMGCFISRPNDMGKAIPVDEAMEYVFGYVLLNDWSARDIQSWEYVPLGPFNGKNFATTISAWVVHPDALDAFRTTGITNDVPLQPYLQESLKENVYDIQLEVDIKSKPT